MLSGLVDVLSLLRVGLIADVVLMHVKPTRSLGSYIKFLQAILEVRSLLTGRDEFGISVLQG